MSMPDISELVIDTDDSYSVASSLTGARSFVQSLKSPSVFDRLSLKETYSTSTRKGRTPSREYSNRLISQTNEDRRHSFPLSPSTVEVRTSVMRQAASPKVGVKSRSPPPPPAAAAQDAASTKEEPKKKESFFERMARTETYASAARKPNPVKNKVAQMSSRKTSPRKDMGETGTRMSASALEPSVPIKAQKSFSSSSHSSTSKEQEEEEDVQI